MSRQGRETQENGQNENGLIANRRDVAIGLHSALTAIAVLFFVLKVHNVGSIGSLLVFVRGVSHSLAPLIAGLAISVVWRRMNSRQSTGTEHSLILLLSLLAQLWFISPFILAGI